VTGARAIAKAAHRRRTAAIKQVAAEARASGPRGELPMQVRIPQLVPQSLNVREHHMVKAIRVKRERSMVSLVLNSRNPPPLPCVVTMVRQFPRALDDDNLTGSCKHARDSVAEWLGIDDRDPRVTWRCKQEKVPRNRAGVVIRFEART
jgi:hypothetical protein